MDQEKGHSELNFGFSLCKIGKIWYNNPMKTKTKKSMPEVKDADLQYGSKMALLSLGVIALLALLKAVVAYLTGLVVLYADALSSFSDMLGIFASYIGLKMSQRHADEGFKYGYYKAESFAAFLASVLIIYLGFAVLRESGERLFVLEAAHDHIFALGQVVVTCVVSFYLAVTLMKAGRKVNSLSLINSGKEKKSDLISQVAVAAGIGASYFHVPYLEGVIGIILSMLILKVGLESGKESLFFLLDYFDDQKLIHRIERIIITKSKIVRKVRNIRMRRAGTIIFGEAFLEINPYVEAKDIHNDLQYLKAKISEADKHIKDFLIFFEVPQIHKVRVAVPVRDDNGLKSTVATSPEDTRFYVFVDVEEGKIVASHTKEFPFQTFDFVGITNFLRDQDAKIVINNNMHSLLFYNLRRLHHILVYPHFHNVPDVESTIKLLLIDT